MAVDDYVKLITSQYQMSTKYLQWMREVLQPLEDVSTFLSTLDEDFDIETAVGDQLDMLGMEFYYPGEGQSPSDEDNATAVARLLADGYGKRLLLSHDVFIKTLLRTYGGFGYAHVFTGFADRLERHGVARGQLFEILTANPKAVFDAAWEGRAS